MRYLATLIFCTGAATLGMELSASRLLEPAFGNNQIVWAALIGLILFYLALGAWLGGVLADRYPQRRALDLTVTLGAVGIALVPLLSTPVLRMAAGGLARFDSGLLAGALLAVLLLFAIPATLLGTATPSLETELNVQRGKLARLALTERPTGATLPTVHGESVVIRILDRSNVQLDLGTIGFAPDTLASWELCYKKPYGALLVTGPTGSGKSTTLYGTLNQLNSPGRQIITIEDPVEYRLAGITQIQVNPKAGLTFAAGLRSILRCDPDVVMIGEIRDKETAQIAMEAALTGHLVLATLHTNDAASAMTRLTEMGIEPFLSSSAIIGVLAQRLARKVCVHCRQPARLPLSKLRGYLGDDDLPAHLPDPVTVPIPRGCDKCGNTGYSGRLGVYEMLSVNEQMESLVANRGAADEIRRMARGHGMRTLREDGLRKVLQGTTTIDELLRTVA